MGMPLSMHQLEGERKTTRKKAQKATVIRHFHNQNSISLHCHTAQLILTHTAAGFLWIFKGAEMLQSWEGKKKTHSLLSQTKTTYQGLASGLNTSLSSVQFTQHTNGVYILKFSQIFLLFSKIRCRGLTRYTQKPPQVLVYPKVLLELSMCWCSGSTSTAQGAVTVTPSVPTVITEGANT